MNLKKMLESRENQFILVMLIISASFLGYWVFGTDMMEKSGLVSVYMTNIPGYRGAGYVVPSEMTEDYIMFTVSHSECGAIKNCLSWEGATSLHLEIDGRDVCEPDRETCIFWGGYNSNLDLPEYRCECRISKAPTGADIYAENYIQVKYQSYSIPVYKVWSSPSYPGHIFFSVPAIKTTGISATAFNDNQVVVISGKVKFITEAPTVCSPAEKRCTGDVLEECSSDGTKWVTVKTCIHGCEAGVCNPPPTECSTDDDCKEMNMDCFGWCDDGTCKSGVNPGCPDDYIWYGYPDCSCKEDLPKCQGNDECKDNEYCDNNECKLLVCDKDQEIVDHECVDKEPEPEEGKIYYEGWIFLILVLILVVLGGAYMVKRSGGNGRVYAIQKRF